jgi:hypothetical protein
MHTLSRRQLLLASGVLAAGTLLGAQAARRRCESGATRARRRHSLRDQCLAGRQPVDVRPLWRNDFNHLLNS